MDKNQRLFRELKSYDLPIDKYIIGASGPLGVRGLREMGDIDIKVSDDLWAELSAIYGTFFDKSGLLKIKLSENIEATCDASFLDKNQSTPKIDDQIKNAEIFDGLPFENIMTTLYFKKLGKRDKDKNDVELIEKWLSENS